MGKLFSEGSTSGPDSMQGSDFRDLLVAIGSDGFDEAEKELHKQHKRCGTDPDKPLTCQAFTASIRQWIASLDDRRYHSGSSGSSRGSSRSSSRRSGSSSDS